MSAFRALFSRKRRNAPPGNQHIGRRGAKEIQHHERPNDECGLLSFETPQNATLEQTFPIDIVAIHGLGGDRKMTWTDEQTGVLWLRDYLPKDLPGARIYSFGYKSQVFGGPEASIADFARQLLIHLELEDVRIPL